jgi:hypothetical protein
MLLLPGENHSSAHLTIPTNLVDRRTKYYSQASHLVRQHQSFCWDANTRIGHLRKNSRTFTKRLYFLWFLKHKKFLIVFFFPVSLNSPSLFSYPSSYPLHFPSFSCATIHCSPSQLLFQPLLIHSFPGFMPLFYPPPTCQHTIPPSYTLTTC